MTTTPDLPPTMPGPLELPRSRDDDHLKLLSVFYFVLAGLNALGGCFGLFYTVLGIVFLANPDMMNDPEAPEELPTVMGATFIVVGLFILILTAVFAILQVMAGRAMRRHRRRTFCLVVAGLSCLSIPLGTTLGIFTFIVLLRPSVTQLFAGAEAQAAAGGRPVG